MSLKRQFARVRAGDKSFWHSGACPSNEERCGPRENSHGFRGAGCQRSRNGLFGIKNYHAKITTGVSRLTVFQITSMARLLTPMQPSVQSVGKKGGSTVS